MSSEPDPTGSLWGPARRVTVPVGDGPGPSPMTDPFPPAGPAWLEPTTASPPSTVASPSYLPPSSPPPARPPIGLPAPVPQPPVPAPPRSGPTGPAVLVGIGLVAAVLVAGLVWSTALTGSVAAPSRSVGAPTFATSAPPVARSTPSTTVLPAASPGGLVVLSPAVGAAPQARTVLALVDRHFSAINDRDYTSWSTTVVARRAADQPVEEWARAYRTTQERSVQIRSITAAGPDRVLVELSFVSTQAVSDAPPDLAVPQICWSSTWPVVDVGSGGRIDTPTRGSTTKSAC